MITFLPTKQQIDALAVLSQCSDLIPPPVEPKYDPFDLALPLPLMTSKRLYEYFLVQTVYQTESNLFTGMFRWKLDHSDVTGDVFTRNNHREFYQASSAFYNKYIENLVSFEWQHSVPDHGCIIEYGLEGCFARIAKARETFCNDPEKLQFCDGMEQIISGLAAWAKKCAEHYRHAAEKESDLVRRAGLLQIAENCETVPLHPAKTFYQGLQCVLFCFYCLPDGIGLLDRYLRKLYQQDLASGRMTREEAKRCLQEFYIHLSAYTVYNGNRGDFSAECHFAVGGYDAEGEDTFDDLSHLIVEALTELDTRRPQISLRWTKKTPYETLKFILDCERKDKNKRIALVNDEPRIEGFQKHCGMSFAQACNYTMVGCNEPTFPGTLWFGGMTVNIVRCLTNTLYHRTEEVTKAKDFEAFYAIFREELEKDMKEIFSYADKFNAMREKDCSMLSNFLLAGCLENATSAIRYGCKTKIGGFELMGITSVIDSLTAIRQFVFEEQRTTLSHLIETMEQNWETDPALRQEILSDCRFFGNHDPSSDRLAQRFTTDLAAISGQYRLRNGAKAILGSLAGYNPHYVEFGARTPATPDGRKAGDILMVGCGQINGKDRKGLLPLLQSVASMDPERILVGAIVCNVMIDAKLVREEKYFDRVCRMIETYFQSGGIHIQLNYVTKEELCHAKKAPEQYQGLKVRVSGFSAPFVKLEDGTQDEIIARTAKGE